MTEKDIKKAIDTIQVREYTKDKMLDNILDSRRKPSRVVSWRTAVPALAVFMVVVTCLVGFTALDTAGKLPVSLVGIADTAKSFFKGDDSNISEIVPTTGEKLTTAGSAEDNSTKPHETKSPDEIASMWNSEGDGDTIAMHFVLNSMRYEKLSAEADVNINDIGNRIGTITTGSDSDVLLNGCNVYQYLPVSGQYLVVLEQKGEYSLYSFVDFEDIPGKEDKDMSVYFDVYGIKSASDITSITLERDGRDPAEVVNPEYIEVIYDACAKLKSDADGYANAVSKYSESITTAADITVPGTTADNVDVIDETATSAEPDKPEDADTVDETVTDVTEETTKASDAKNKALADAITVKINAVNGLTYECVFYPNISYIAQYPVGYELAGFMNTLLL